MQIETDIAALSNFIQSWQDTPEQNREVFIRLKSYLAQKDGVNLQFIERAGITYSLRASHAAQKDRELFVMVDVIEDTPRWLSVCFYNQMLTDPEEMGDFVPSGLLGEDALCFDIQEWDEKFISYVENRVDEAYKSAS
ncbi:MAG: hypothetical protein HQK64_07355 [Desulfamplus sp.]|nr:hypothetical protein [Desulfamplus sp.]MBF0242278.1 hypothetical protein [Desulfamplus sp.]